MFTSQINDSNVSEEILQQIGWRNQVLIIEKLKSSRKIISRNFSQSTQLSSALPATYR